jgi:hypothetical protein
LTPGGGFLKPSSGHLEKRFLRLTSGVNFVTLFTVISNEYLQ